ncbi:MAG: PIN domain-containing protein [Planctomycetes bacterium]|nr:PIN domain-containing protein [Planctomycetota bacterium]
MKVFLDTNVLLDVLARREPFYSDSVKIWTLAEAGHLVGFASTLSFPNLFYLLRKAKGPKNALKTIGILRDIFSLVPLDAQIVNQAIDSDIADFEDAIQFFSALHADAAALITRNPGDFPGTGVAIQTPAEFLATNFPG